MVEVFHCICKAEAWYLDVDTRGVICCSCNIVIHKPERN